MDTTYLSPVENPSGLVMKLVYYFSRRQFGKVPTPVKVYASRLPSAFGQFYGKIGQLDKKMVLAKETAFLVRQQVARLNICLFCIDIGRWFAVKESMDTAKFDALGGYETSPLFSGAERAALDFATQLTRDKKVDPGAFGRLKAHYSEREICEIVYLVASEHVYNLTNIGLNIHSDMLCDLDGRKKAKAG